MRGRYPVTLNLNEEEIAHLDQMRGEVARSTYVKAVLFKPKRDVAAYIRDDIRLTKQEGVEFPAPMQKSPASILHNCKCGHAPERHQRLGARACLECACVKFREDTDA